MPTPSLSGPVPPIVVTGLPTAIRDASEKFLGPTDAQVYLSTSGVAETEGSVRLWPATTLAERSDARWLTRDS